MSAVEIVSDRTIDSPLQVDRFPVVFKTGELLLQEVMSYGLSSFLHVLFEARNVFRKGDKHQLAHAIREHVKYDILDSVSKREYHVLDKSVLLHRITRKPEASYSGIAQL